MNEELLSKVLKAKNADEILSLAHEKGMDLSKEGAEEIFSRYHKSGALGDDELDAVAGGDDKCGGKNDNSSPKYSLGQNITWNWSVYHCGIDGSSNGNIVNIRTATDGEASSGYYVYPGTVIYTVKCPKCGSLMEIPEVWVQ